MSERTFDFVVGRLLTDEDLRRQFAFDPLDMLAAWLNAGLDLSSREIDALFEVEVTRLARPVVDA